MKASRVTGRNIFYDVFVFIVVFSVFALVLAAPYVLAVLSPVCILLVVLVALQGADYGLVKPEFVAVRASGRSPPSL